MKYLVIYVENTPHYGFAVNEVFAQITDLSVENTDLAAPRLLV